MANAAALVTILSVLSPLAGLFLEISLAWKFGASGTVDAFRTAYLLIGFGTQLFVGFLLPHIIVPVISRYRAGGNEGAGWRVALTFGQALTFAALLFAAWVLAYPAPLSHVLAPGLRGDSLTQSLSLIRLFAVAFSIVLWCGVVTGILHVHQIFVLPLVSQMICNLSIAAGVFLCAGRGTAGIVIGSSFGFGVMLLLHVYALVRIARQTGIPLFSKFRPALVADVAAVFRQSVPLLVLALAGMAGTAILTSSISRLSTGSLAIFGYASKLQMIVLFGSGSLATVIFPALAGAFARREEQIFSQLATRGVRMVLLLTVPLTGLAYVLREPLVNIVFDRGALSPKDLAMVAHLFAILLFQAPASAIGFLLLKVFFAHGDTRSPAVFHLLFPLALYLMVPVAIGSFGGSGILAALDLVSWLVTLSLLFYAIARYRIIEWRPLGRFCVMLAIFSAVLALPAVGVHHVFRLLGPPRFSLSVAELSAAAGLVAPLAFFASRALSLGEAREIENFLVWRFRWQERFAHLGGFSKC